VRVSVGLPIDRADPTGQFLTATGISVCAQAAQTAGFHAVFATDHPAPDSKWLRTGGHPTLDPFIALSFAAAATSHIHLHTNLLVLPYRNPLLTAKSVASLDVLSNGRVIVGVGVGYLESEYDALGVQFSDRAALSDDALIAMLSAWRGEPFDHVGLGYNARNTVVQPTPMQQPHPPVWIGGNSKRAIERVVAFGNGWSPMPSSAASARYLGTPGMDSISDFVERMKMFTDLMAASGRTDAVDVAVIPTALSGFGSLNWSPAALHDEIGQLTAAGATVLVVNVGATHPLEYAERVAQLGSEIISTLT